MEYIQLLGILFLAYLVTAYLIIPIIYLLRTTYPAYVYKAVTGTVIRLCKDCTSDET